MRFFKLFLSAILFIALPSCATINRIKPYQNMETLSFNGNSTGATGYEFKNPDSKKLLIILEGSGWWSVLGTKNKNRWTSVGFTAVLEPLLRDNYTVFVPEKFNRVPGVRARVYFNDREQRARYTFNGLLACYKESIEKYLSGKNYESIVIVGVSEGGLILPALYSQLKNSGITLLVSVAYGGLSFRENYAILSESDLPPRSWKKHIYNRVLEKYRGEKPSDSLEEGVGWAPYHYWNSVIDVRPFEYYERITIPVLFVHGEKDFNVPVESTRYVEQNLPKKPFTYIYYPKMAHNPYPYKKAAATWGEDIKNWIIKNDP